MYQPGVKDTTMKVENLHVGLTLIIVFTSSLLLGKFKKIYELDLY